MSIQYKTIKELTLMLKAKEISNKELIQETFDLIESNSHLNAFVTLNKENALNKAKAIDNKASDLSLSGIPIAQKDLFVTKNLRTTCGSNMLSNFIPPYSCLLYTSPSPRDQRGSRMPSSA